jgi:hypothetical protein
VLAAVGGLIDSRRPARAASAAAGGHSSDDGVEDLRIAQRDRQVGLQHLRESLGHRLPRGAAICGLEDAPGVLVGVPAKGAPFDKTLLLLPECGVHDIRVARVDADIVAARVFVLVEHLLEALAAVGRSEDAALRAGSVRVAENRDEEPVRIPRRDIDHRDHLAVEQPEMDPRPAGVG